MTDIFSGVLVRDWPKLFLINVFSDLMLPSYIKHSNYASPLVGRNKNMKGYFDLDIKRTKLEDMVTSCRPVYGG